MSHPYQVHEDLVPFLQPQLLVLTSYRRLHRLQWHSAPPPPPGPAAWSGSGADPFAQPQLRFVLRTAPDHPKAGGYTLSLWDEAFKQHHYKDNALNRWL